MQDHGSPRCDAVALICFETVLKQEKIPRFSFFIVVSHCVICTGYAYLCSTDGMGTLRKDKVTIVLSSLVSSYTFYRQVKRSCASIVEHVSFPEMRCSSVETRKNAIYVTACRI